MKKLTLLSLFLFSCSLFLIGSAFAAADQAICTVVALRGRPEVLHNGVTHFLKIKDPLYRHDTVKTGKRGRIQLMFLDNTLISLGRNTEMNLAAYTWQPSKGKAALRTKIKEGVFRVMGGAIAKVAPQNFTTETPTATIGIRGSMYAGWASPKQCQVVFQGGHGITLTNALGAVAITTPGFGSRAVANKKPEQPVRFSAAEINQLNKDLAPTASNGKTAPKQNTAQSSSKTTAKQASNGKTTSKQTAENSSSQTTEQTTTTENSSTTASSSSGTTASTSSETTQSQTSDQTGSGTALTDQTTVVSDTQVQTTDTTTTSTIDTSLPLAGTTQTTDTTTVDVPIPPPNDQGTSSVPTTPPPPVQYNGAYSANLYDLTNATLADNWQGSTVLTQDSTTPSQYSGTIASNSPVAFDTAGATQFNNYSVLSPARNVTLNGTSVPLDPSTVNFLNSNDFFVISGAAGFSPSILIGGGNLGYEDLAYAGKPTATIPTSGLGRFSMAVDGAITYNNATPNAKDAIAAVGDVWVDFGNGTVIGRILGYNRSLYRVKNGLPLGVSSLADAMENADGSALTDPTLPLKDTGDLPLDRGLFFGSLNGNTLANVTFIAGGNRNNTSNGSGLGYQSQLLTGNVFGAKGEGLGWTLTDSVYSDTGSQVGTANMVGAGIEEGLKASTLVASTYKGYAIGIGEQDDSAGNLISNSIFRNQNDQIGDFSINIGADGSVNGALHLSDTNAASLDLTIGGAGKGAAVDNDHFIAELQDASGVNGFLFSNFGQAPKPLTFNNVSWGYWTSPPTSPSSLGSHLAGLWIAGDQSALVQTRLNDLLTNTPSLLGVYDGNALLQSNDYNNNLFNVQVGAAHFEMDFQNLTFSGSLNFPVAGSNQGYAIKGSIDANGFSSNNILVDGMTPDAAGLSGNFYGAGSELDSIAGSFFTITGTTYNSGIFGGDLPASGMAPIVSAPLTSGRFSGIYFTPTTQTTTAGTLAGLNSGGSFSGSVTDQAGNTMAVAFPMPFYDQAITDFMPNVNSSYSITRNLAGQSFTFSPAELWESPTGDFAYLNLPYGSFSTSTTAYQYNELSFVGEPTTTSLIPADGIDYYVGDIQDIFTQQQAPVGIPNGIWAETDPVQLFVNWKNKTFVGVINSYSGNQGMLAHVFFMGNISGNQLVNLRFLGHGFDPFTSAVSALAGTDTFAQIYGVNYQGIGFTGTGSMLDLNNTTLSAQTIISDIGAAHRLSDPLSTAVAPTGTANFEGYVVGLSENIQNPSSQRRIFMNSDPSLFSMTIDRDKGTITGSLSAVNIDSASPSTPDKLNNLEIGGTNGSAYITDKGFIAAIGDSTGTAISSSGSTGTIKSDGNLLITEDPHKQSGATYATWGYWEVAYQDPSNLGQYHLHEPGALWVAGERTPAADVQNLIDTKAVGSYSGIAQGVQIDSSQNVIDLPTGTMNLKVDFGNYTAANAVTGNISFPQVTATATNPGSAAVSLDIGSAANTLSTSGFTAQVNGASSSAVNGAFYGPNAKTVGGNFRADLSTGRYMGIFAGDKP